MDTALLDLVDTSYETELDEQAWLGALAKRAAELLDDGLGAAAYVYDARFKEPIITTLAFSERFDPSWLAEFMASEEAAKVAAKAKGTPIPASPVGVHGPCELPKWMHLPCGTVTTIDGMEDVAERLVAFGGAKDVFAVNGTDPTRFGIWIGAPLRAARKPSKQTIALYTRVATHLASAYRLRRALVGAPAEPEAVVEPNGTIVHAEGDAQSEEARDELRRAVIALDRSRTRERRTDDDATTLARTGLVSGRWSLVDRFESDGRHFLLARANESNLARPVQLSARERQALAHAALGRSNKEIAYELGLAPSTVRVLLHRAGTKLGMRNRAETVATFLRHDGHVPGAPAEPLSRS